MTQYTLKYEKPMVMAEIGCNHMGQLEIAKELLDLAKRCGCNFAKFQKRNPKEVLTPEQYSAPHPVPYTQAVQHMANTVSFSSSLSKNIANLRLTLTKLV